MWLKRYIDDFGVESSQLHQLKEKRVGNDVWIGTPEAIAFNLLKVNRAGIRAFRIYRNGYKPTTNLVQISGMIKERYVELEEKEMLEFLQGHDLKRELDMRPGFVILGYRGFPLGVGRYRDGRIKNQIPRSRRIMKVASS